MPLSPFLQPLFFPLSLSLTLSLSHSLNSFLSFTISLSLSLSHYLSLSLLPALHPNKIFIICIHPLLKKLNKNSKVNEVRILRNMQQVMKSNLKIKLLQMILLSSVKKALPAYSKFSRNTKD